MSSKIIEKFIVDILQKEMLIPANNIWIYSQNRKIPDKAEGLYANVGMIHSKIVSSKSYYRDMDDKEVQEVLECCSVQINVMSYDNSARDRRNEVVMALNSFYAIELMEKELFRINEIPSSFVNTSTLFGGSELNVFSIVVKCFFTTRKIKTTNYYDTFSIETHQQNTTTTDVDSIDVSGV